MNSKSGELKNASIGANALQKNEGWKNANDLGAVLVTRSLMLLDQMMMNVLVKQVQFVRMPRLSSILTPF